MSNDFVEIKDPDAVRAGAVRISAEGDALDAQAQSRLGAIEGIEAEAPWGSDKFGKAFRDGYEHSEGGGPQANTSVKDSLRGLGPEATRIGDAATMAMLDYTTADEVNAQDINSVR